MSCEPAGTAAHPPTRFSLYNKLLSRAHKLCLRCRRDHQIMDFVAFKRNVEFPVKPLWIRRDVADCGVRIHCCACSECRVSHRQSHRIRYLSQQHTSNNWPINGVQSTDFANRHIDWVRRPLQLSVNVCASVRVTDVSRASHRSTTNVLPVLKSNSEHLHRALGRNGV